MYLKCEECHLYYPQAGVHIDHIVPWVNLGLFANRAEEITAFNDLRNLRIVCSFCNLQKRNDEHWHYHGEWRDGLADADYEDDVEHFGHMGFWPPEMV